MVGTAFGRLTAYWIGALALAALLTRSPSAQALPNTHAPAISTWDPRASSIVFGLGQAMTGAGDFTYLSYSANFSSTNGVLSAQFGLHYMTLRNGDDGPAARGVSAGGVALISLPLSSLFDNGVPRTSFAFYIGGVPTALVSGELNYISIPLVLGVGLPCSPTPYFTLRPWLELSPGINFDTRIQAVATDQAIQSAMDGTLTREEVQDLVEQGLDIHRETTVGKRAGLSLSAHLGERVDFDVNMMLGAGRGSAFGLGAALVLRWDTMVQKLARQEPEDEDCAALAARYHRSCPLRRAPAPGARGTAPATSPRVAPTPPHRTHAPPATTHAPPATTTAPLHAAPAATTAPTATPTPAPKKAAPKPAPPAATPGPTAPARTDELPPLQAAPPRPL